MEWHSLRPWYSREHRHVNEMMTYRKIGVGTIPLLLVVTKLNFKSKERFCSGSVQILKRCFRFPLTLYAAIKDNGHNMTLNNNKNDILDDKNKNNNHNNNHNHNAGGQKTALTMFDDPRLFLHRDEVWMSFSLYGDENLEYQKRQLFAPLHIRNTSSTTRNNDVFSQPVRVNGDQTQLNHMNKPGGSIVAFVKEWEIINVCCGRNMAVLDLHYHDRNNSQRYNKDDTLSIVEHVDPVSVVHVDSRSDSSSLSTSKQLQTRSAEEEKQSLEWISADNLEKGEPIFQDYSGPNNTRGTQRKRLSHFHGNPGFMPYIAEWDEFLSIGHFHRPQQYWSGWKNTTTKTKTSDGHVITTTRQQKDGVNNQYAPYGHHYTHAFFTLSAQPPYRLKRLSNEFVFAAKHQPLDGDIAQFVTSLEIVSESIIRRANHTTKNTNKQGANDDDSYALIGYGINDCESSIVLIQLARIQAMLQETVAQGSVGDHTLPVEVVDLMQPVAVPMDRFTAMASTGSLKSIIR